MNHLEDEFLRLLLPPPALLWRSHLGCKLAHRGLEAAAVSKALGWPEGRLQSLLDGREELEMADLCAVLIEIGEPPTRFLREVEATARFCLLALARPSMPIAGDGGPPARLPSPLPAHGRPSPLALAWTAMKRQLREHGRSEGEAEDEPDVTSDGRHRRLTPAESSSASPSNEEAEVPQPPGPAKR